MGQRDDRYTLEGMIEADEGYFSVEASALERSKQKAGRGSKTKSNVMVMAESTVLEDLETGEVDKQCRYFKAKVLDSHKTDKTLRKAIYGEKSIVFSDKSTSYLNIEDYVSIHMTEKSSEQMTKQTLRWFILPLEMQKKTCRNFIKLRESTSNYTLMSSFINSTEDILETKYSTD